MNGRAYNQLLEAAMGAAMLKDYGKHAWYGATAASKRTIKKYLRKHRLGKFAKRK